MKAKLLTLAVVSSLAGAACSNAFLEPLQSGVTNVDDRLTIAGRVCTAPPDPNGFPVKVVFVVDQSGSMCVSDPPGSQGSPGFCEMYAVVPPGVTQPGRVRAMNRLLDQFAGQPNVSVALVPFETNVKGQWPTGVGSGSSRFGSPQDPELRRRVNDLQATLGKGTDYQGALAYAYGLIASDIDQVQTRSPQLLPRTRYVVVFLTDGTPYPRCTGNDALGQYADDLHPDLTWADSYGAGDFCNQVDPTDPDYITGFVKGTDRNQNYQLFSYVRQLMSLKDQFNIGDVRLHTVLLFNEQAVAACGPICQDLYGQYVRWPGGGAAPVPVANGPLAAHQIARWLLRQMADLGNGIYQEFNDFGGIGTLSLGQIDYGSLANKFVMKTLLVQPLRSVPGDVHREEDSDGDGLPDSVDTAFANHTSPYDSDSDGDGFDDNFEVRHRDVGFRADQRDGRGCDPASPLTPGCNAIQDNDGDGLTDQWAEAYLKTRDGIVDSDGDGIPDGLEVRYGLDPLTPQGGIDTDGDGVSDLQEVKMGANPIKPDKAYRDVYGFQYDVRGEEQADGRFCYDFSVSNIQLVTPPLKSGEQQGYNLFKVWFAEAPESGAATDYGNWKVACAWAQYDPPQVRVPAGPGTPPIAAVDAPGAGARWFAPAQLIRRDQYLGPACVGVVPSQEARP